jgi:hypothetical protein
MTKNNGLNPENMSKEELLALFMKTQAELNATKEKLKKNCREKHKA